MTIKDYQYRHIFIGYPEHAREFQDEYIIPKMKKGFTMEYSTKPFNKNSNGTKELIVHTWILRDINKGDTM